MNARNKFLIMLGVILAIASVYYLLSTPRGSDLVLVGTVDANQIVVSPQIQGRILKLLVEEGTQVKQGDLIALLDPSELEAEERAAVATIASMRSQVGANEYTFKSTKGSTTSDVSNAQAKLQSARAQLAQAEAMLTRIESDSRRTIGLAQAGVASDQDRVQAEMNLKAQEASVQSLKEQVTAAQADLTSAIVVGIAAAVREYAGSLRAAQQKVTAYAAAAQDAQTAGNSPASLAPAGTGGAGRGHGGRGAAGRRGPGGHDGTGSQHAAGRPVRPGRCGAGLDLTGVACAVGFPGGHAVPGRLPGRRGGRPGKRGTGRGVRQGPAGAHVGQVRGVRRAVDVRAE